MVSDKHFGGRVMKVSPILQADKTKENIQKYTDQWRRNFANGKNNKNSEF